MATYEFVTIWRIEAPIEQVWEELYHSERWPTWWPGVERVEVIEQGDARGVGNIRRYTWKSKLPYRLTFDMRMLRVEPPHLLEGWATGELEGSGLWQLTRHESATVTRYDWKVDTTRRWMQQLAPIARPLFAWNHNVIMSWGAKGLADKLGVNVVEQKAP